MSAPASNSTSSMTAPPSGNGLTAATATWGPDVYSNPGISPQYVAVNVLGDPPRFQRVSLSEALQLRNTNPAIRIYDGTTLLLPGQLSAGSQPNPAPPVHATASNLATAHPRGTASVPAKAPAGSTAAGRMIAGTHILVVRNIGGQFTDHLMLIPGSDEDDVSNAGTGGS